MARNIPKTRPLASARLKVAKIAVFRHTGTDDQQFKHFVLANGKRR